MISRRLATLHELDTCYGVRDLWDMMEIITVDTHNRNVLSAPRT